MFYKDSQLYLKNYLPLNVALNYEENIKKFEPANIARDYSDIDIEKYAHIVEFIQKLQDSFINRKKINGRELNLIKKYLYICRIMKWNESGKLLRDNVAYNFTNAEANLIIILSSDPEFKYLQDHNYCINNNLVEADFFNKKYGFYSRKLILMETYGLHFLSKLSREEETNKRNK